MMVPMIVLLAAGVHAHLQEEIKLIVTIRWDEINSDTGIASVVEGVSLIDGAVTLKAKNLEGKEDGELVINYEGECKYEEVTWHCVEDHCKKAGCDGWEAYYKIAVVIAKRKSMGIGESLMLGAALSKKDPENESCFGLPDLMAAKIGDGKHPGGFYEKLGYVDSKHRPRLALHIRGNQCACYTCKNKITEHRLGYMRFAGMILKGGTEITNSYNYSINGTRRSDLPFREWRRQDVKLVLPEGVSYRESFVVRRTRSLRGEDLLCLVLVC